MSSAEIIELIDKGIAKFDSEEDSAKFVGALHAMIEQYDRGYAEMGEAHEKETIRLKQSLQGEAVFHMYASAAMQGIIHKGSFGTPQQAVELAFNFALAAITRHNQIMGAQD